MKGYYLMPHPPIMIPEVGKGEEKKIINTIDSCKKIGEEIKNNDVNTIIIITPHGSIFRDGVAIINEERIKGDLSKFGVSEVSFDLKINKELTENIIENCNELKLPIVSLNKDKADIYDVSLELDHGALVPLYYILKNKEYKIVHITYGMLSPLELYRIGMQVEKAVEELGNNTALIASGDLSHRLKNNETYKYSESGEIFDKELMKILEFGDMSNLFGIDEKLICEAGECGLRSLYILAGALDKKEVKGEVLSYEGPFGVGYGVVKFNTKDGSSLYNILISNKEEKHRKRMKEGNPYTRLARRNLDKFLKTRISLSTDEVIEEGLLSDKKGVFVSLKINGDLRGCIGTIKPVTENIAEEIIRNSISAAFNDPRFPELREEELLEVDISVDLLHNIEKCSKEDLDPKMYGVIVQNGERTGLLLPNLDGIEDYEAQIEIALQKANILPYEHYSIFRFKVDRFEED